jgi:hypothetical protein
MEQTMSAITLDPDFPGQVSQPADGQTVEIERGAVWDYIEGSQSTEIYLSDCDDRRAIGVCFCLDWSQLGVPMPEALEDRLEATLMEHGAIREELNRLLAKR